MNNTVLFCLVAILFTGCVSGKRYRLKLVKRDPVEKPSLIKRMSLSVSLPTFDKREHTLSLKKKIIRPVFTKVKSEPIAIISPRKILRYSCRPPQVDEISESDDKKKIGRGWYLLGAFLLLGASMFLFYVMVYEMWWNLIWVIFVLSLGGVVMSGIAIGRYDWGDTTLGVILSAILLITAILWSSLLMVIAFGVE